MEKGLIFFYSPKCKYSTLMITKIMQNELREIFMMVDITKGFKIPSFVDRIPMIFIKNSKEIIVDESIENFIDMLIRENFVKRHGNNNNNNTSAINMPRQQQQNDDVLGEISCASDHFKGISDGFSFIEGNGEAMHSRNYLTINSSGDETSSINSDMEKLGIKEPKFSDQQFDNFVSQRDSDLANMFPRKNVV